MGIYCRNGKILLSLWRELYFTHGGLSWIPKLYVPLSTTRCVSWTNTWSDHPYHRVTERSQMTMSESCYSIHCAPWDTTQPKCIKMGPWFIAIGRFKWKSCKVESDRNICHSFLGKKKKQIIRFRENLVEVRANGYRLLKWRTWV